LSEVANRDVEIEMICEELLQPSSKSDQYWTPLLALDLAKNPERLWAHLVGRVGDTNLLSRLVEDGESPEALEALQSQAKEKLEHLKTELSTFATTTAAGSHLTGAEADAVRRSCTAEALFVSRTVLVGKRWEPRRFLNKGAVQTCRDAQSKYLTAARAGVQSALEAGLKTAENRALDLLRELPKCEGSQSSESLCDLVARARAIRSFLDARRKQLASVGPAQFFKVIEPDGPARMMVRSLERAARRLDRHVESLDSRTYGLTSIAVEVGGDSLLYEVSRDFIGPFLGKHRISLATLARAACGEMRSRREQIDNSILAPAVYRALIATFSGSADASSVSTALAVMDASGHAAAPGQSTQASMVADVSHELRQALQGQLQAWMADPNATSEENLVDAATLTEQGLPATATVEQARAALEGKSSTSGPGQEGPARAPEGAVRSLAESVGALGRSVDLFRDVMAAEQKTTREQLAQGARTSEELKTATIKQAEALIDLLTGLDRHALNGSKALLVPSLVADFCARVRAGGNKDQISCVDDGARATILLAEFPSSIFLDEFRQTDLVAWRSDAETVQRCNGAANERCLKRQIQPIRDAMQALKYAVSRAPFTFTIEVLGSSDLSAPTGQTPCRDLKARRASAGLEKSPSEDATALFSACSSSCEKAGPGGDCPSSYNEYLSQTRAEWIAKRVESVPGARARSQALPAGARPKEARPQLRRSVVILTAGGLASAEARDSKASGPQPASATGGSQPASAP
jgi:hypothetical protein